MTELIGKNYIYYILSVILAVIGSALTLIYTYKHLNIEVIKAIKDSKKISDRVKIKRKQGSPLTPFEILKRNIVKFSVLSIIYIVLFLLITYLGDKKLDISDFKRYLQVLEKLIVLPILVAIFIIDTKKRIIPNRVLLTLFEIIAGFTLMIGIMTDNTYMIDRIYGLIAGLLIFGLMAIMGKMFIGKDAMGIGDIKFMTAIGLMVGPLKMLDITLIAFTLALVFSIIITVFRKYKEIEDDYIAFGPFLTFGIVISLFLNPGTIVNIFSDIFKLGK
ncbi:MAG: prepilin peptidase [Clostridiales bacterium]|nr:prepilin peptidase [Clostridiales bacterium]